MWEANTKPGERISIIEQSVRLCRILGEKFGIFVQRTGGASLRSNIYAKRHFCVNKSRLVVVPPRSARQSRGRKKGRARVDLRRKRARNIYRLSKFNNLHNELPVSRRYFLPLLRHRHPLPL